MAWQSIAAIEHLADFAVRFLERYPRGGVFGLRGDLGVGKTTFVREVVGLLARQANVPSPRVTSPSYVVHQHYPLKPGIDHYDFYRLENSHPNDPHKGLLDLGYFETVQKAEEKKGFVFIEWPERLADGLNLTATVCFKFGQDDPTHRRVRIVSTEPPQTRPPTQSR